MGISSSVINSISAGIEISIGVITTVIGAATGNPGLIVGGVGGIIDGGSDLVNLANEEKQKELEASMPKAETGTKPMGAPTETATPQPEVNLDNLYNRNMALKDRGRKLYY